MKEVGRCAITYYMEKTNIIWIYYLLIIGGVTQFLKLEINSAFKARITLKHNRYAMTPLRSALTDSSLNISTLIQCSVHDVSMNCSIYKYCLFYQIT